MTETQIIQMEQTFIEQLHAKNQVNLQLLANKEVLEQEINRLQAVNADLTEQVAKLTPAKVEPKQK